MSLISDALRKARQESAQREARARGLERPMVAGRWRRTNRVPFSIAVAAVAMVVAAAVGAWAMWWLLGSRGGQPAVASAASTEPAASIGAQEVVPPKEAENGEPAPTGEQANPAVASPVAVDPEIHPHPTAEDVTKTAEVRPAREAPPITDEAPSVRPTAGSADPVGSAGGEFVAEADLGNVTLTLDYLVYRKDNPFAQINGRDVHVGGVVEGWVVSSITADRVVLTKDDATVVLKVR